MFDVKFYSNHENALAWDVCFTKEMLVLNLVTCLTFLDLM